MAFITRTFILAIICTGLAAQDVQVAAGEILGLVNKDKNGVFQLILKEAAKRSGVSYQENVYPLKRALAKFLNKESLAIYTMIGSIVNHLGEEAVITTFPLGVNRLHIYTLKDTASISRYSELDGKVIGGLLGYEFFYQQITGRGLSIQYIADEQNLLKMLKAGRIDAALGFMPDWIPFLDSLTYDPNFIIHNGYDYMTVWNTPEGKIFVHKISIALQSMKADGSLAKILGERYMDFDYTKLKLYEWDPEQAL